MNNAYEHLSNTDVLKSMISYDEHKCLFSVIFSLMYVCQNPDNSDIGP